MEKQSDQELTLLLRNELDEPILSHVMMLLARITATETLLVLAWTNELAKQDDPLKAAEDLKDTTKGGAPGLRYHRKSESIRNKFSSHAQRLPAASPGSGDNAAWHCNVCSPPGYVEDKTILACTFEFLDAHGDRRLNLSFIIRTATQSLDSDGGTC